MCHCRRPISKSRDLRQALDEAKFPQSNLIHRGQWDSKTVVKMFDLFRRAIFENKVVPEESLLLAGCVSPKRSRVSDPAGNAKASQKSGEGSKRGRAKDDAVRRRRFCAVAEGMRRRGLATSNELNYVICGLKMSRNHAKLDQKRWEYVRKQVFERDWI